jgi:SAM-dependent methyltransferase
VTPVPDRNGPSPPAEHAPPEFDQHGARYEAAMADAIGFAGQPHDVYIEAKGRKLLELAARHLSGRRPEVLDVGCGIGLTDRHLLGHVRSLHGVDVSEAMVKRAREANPEVDYRVYDGTRLPYEDDSFDLAFAICVLHHVAPAARPGLLRELRRVARPAGLVAVFEHNPWNPFTRRVVRQCVFDEDIELLSRRELAAGFRAAGLKVMDAEFIVLTPWRSRALEALERRLACIPLGAQYLVAGRPSG